MLGSLERIAVRCSSVELGFVPDAAAPAFFVATDRAALIPTPRGARPKNDTRRVRSPSEIESRSRRLASFFDGDPDVLSCEIEPWEPDLQRGTFASIVEGLLAEGISVRFRAGGRSMTPTIEDGEVLIVAPIAAPDVKVADVVFCQPRSRSVAHQFSPSKETQPKQPG